MEKYGYPVAIEPNGEGGYIASFKDIPEALTKGWSLEEVKDNALKALITAVEFYIEDSRSFPLPSEPQKNEEIVVLPVYVISKVLLLNAMAEQC